MDELEDLGFNPGIFHSAIPMVQPVEHVDNEDKQVAQLVAQKGAFSASVATLEYIWNTIWKCRCCE